MKRSAHLMLVVMLVIIVVPFNSATTGQYPSLSGALASDTSITSAGTKACYTLNVGDVQAYTLKDISPSAWQPQVTFQASLNKVDVAGREVAFTVNGASHLLQFARGNLAYLTVYAESNSDPVKHPEPLLNVAVTAEIVDEQQANLCFRSDGISLHLCSAPGTSLESMIKWCNKQYGEHTSFCKKLTDYCSSEPKEPVCGDDICVWDPEYQTCPSDCTRTPTEGLFCDCTLPLDASDRCSTVCACSERCIPDTPDRSRKLGKETEQCLAQCEATPIELKPETSLYELPEPSPVKPAPPPVVEPKQYPEPVVTCDSGCYLEESRACVPLGHRMVQDRVPVYCSLSGAFEKQKELGSEADNPYECESNVVTNRYCVDVEAQLSLLQKIMKVLSKIFGGN